MGAQVASSKGVMVVGAGLSGLEVAGEIATAHPNLPVKLISSKSALGDGMPPAIGTDSTRRARTHQKHP